MEEKPKKVFDTIEQAGNYLEEKKETMKEQVEKDAKEAPISTCDPAQAKKYLLYGISLLTDISESLKCSWCMAARKPSSLYSTREVAQMLAKLLAMRLNGYSVAYIARKLGVTPVSIMQSEKIAIKAVQESINKYRNSGIAIIGG